MVLKVNDGRSNEIIHLRSRIYRLEYKNKHKFKPLTPSNGISGYLFMEQIQRKYTEKKEVGVIGSKNEWNML